MASNSAWSKSVPSGLSRVADGDDAIRSFKSHMEAWWEDEHYATGGSTSSAGRHRVGSARVYQGTTSQLSNPTGDGSHRLFHATDTGGLYVANPSTSSWTLLTNSITLGSAQTWTALQEFSAGAKASNVTTDNLKMPDMFSGWTSYSTRTNLASITADTVRAWVATDGVASRATAGDFAVMNMSDPNNALILTATPAAGQITLNVRNAGTIAHDPSDQTYTVFLFQAGHLQ